MKKTLLGGFVVVSLLTTSLMAKEKTMQQLSKEMANPLAQIWNLSFQNNYTTMKGDAISGKEHINTTLFQPVLPIPINDEWMFFVRPVITYIDAPSNGSIIGGTPSHPIVHGRDKESDFGDLILPVGVGKVKKQSFSWGAGATFIFPTSQHNLVASHQYQAGPTALALWANDKWTIGTHIQHWWGVKKEGGYKNKEYANHTDIQYFVVYNLPHAWQLRASPHITYNWNASHNNKLTLPVALGVGKMIKIGPMPVQLMAEYQKTVISPDTVGADSTIMLQANFIIKNPFGNL